MSERPIPYGRHWLDEADRRAVLDVLESDWLTQGPVVEAFESDLAKRCGAEYAVVCNSGTAALHLAMLAAAVGPGDEVVVPANTFVASANCAVYTGARPRFADVDPLTGLLDAERAGRALSERTRALIPVHFAGLPCDMESLARWRDSTCPEVVLVEDASHALGAEHPDGTPVGSLRFADMVVFSFHPVKHVATGEGGAVLTDREDLVERLRLFRSHGTTKDPESLHRPAEGPWYYEMQELGFNYRIPDLNCALGRSQLRRLDQFLARRREIATHYHERLSGLPHTRLPSPAVVRESAWHLYCLHVDWERLGRTRIEVVAALAERGIHTQVHYYPVPLQPFYRSLLGHGEGDFPGAEAHYREALTIPLFPAMSDDDEHRVVRALGEVFR